MNTKGVSIRKEGSDMGKRHYCDNSHLTLEERETIQIGIANRATKAAIARTIGKDPSTVAKEINKHKYLKPRNAFNNSSDCIHQYSCGGCRPNVRRCERYKRETCSGRDRSPGACNNCPEIKKCRLDKYFYDAKKADREYRKKLVESRLDINMTKERLQAIGEVIGPLLKQGQSVYQIVSAHPELGISQRTIYNYISQQVFKDSGIDYFDLKEKLGRKVKKRPKNKLEKRKNTNYEGRCYKDFLDCLDLDPDIPVVEMDTVYNDPRGPYIQTFFFRASSLMIGFIHQEKTAESMSNTLNILQDRLSIDTFRLLFPVILTDRGSEFQKPELFEFDKNGELRTNIYYCDPQQVNQKSRIENNHNYIRDIIPNKTSMNGISNEDLELVFSHINSTPRKSLNGRTPYELFELIYSSSITDLFGIKKLQRDEVVLTPYLLKLNKK